MKQAFLFLCGRFGRSAAAPLLGMLLLGSAGGGVSAQGASAEDAESPPDSGSDGKVELPEFLKKDPLPPEHLRLEPLPPDAPKPSADPRNFEGTWFHADLIERAVTKTMHGKPVPLSAEGWKILEHRLAAVKAGAPLANASTLCLPPAQTWQVDLNFPFTVIQDKREIYFVFEEFHGVWKIRMNQPHRPDGAREYMGDSVGHWEGDTLVVDTINYKASWWVDGAGVPMSKEGRLIQRIRRIDEESGPALEVVTTFDDPTLFKSKWSTVRSHVWRPDKAIFAEYNCEEQIGAPDGLFRYGVTKEQ